MEKKSRGGRGNPRVFCSTPKRCLLAGKADYPYQTTGTTLASNWVHEGAGCSKPVVTQPVLEIKSNLTATSGSGRYRRYSSWGQQLNNRSCYFMGDLLALHYPFLAHHFSSQPHCREFWLFYSLTVFLSLSCSKNTKITTPARAVKPQLDTVAYVYHW